MSYQNEDTPLTIETGTVEVGTYRFSANPCIDRCLCLAIFVWILACGLACIATYQYVSCSYDCDYSFIVMWVLWGLVLMPVAMFIILVCLLGLEVLMRRK